MADEREPRTPAEALRHGAWLTFERGAIYAQESITPPMPPMSAVTAYEYALACEIKADVLEDAGEALLSEAARLEAPEPQTMSDEDLLGVGLDANAAHVDAQSFGIDSTRKLAGRLIARLAKRGFAIVRVRP